MIRIVIAFFVISVLSFSCEKKLNQGNPNEATEETFWKTKKDFQQALTSCYTPLKNALNGGYYGTRGVMLRIARADGVEFRNDITDVYTVSRFTNSTTNSLVQGMFYQLYNGLYRTNSILQKIQKRSFSEDFTSEVRGEALFLRGYFFFVLGKEFKDVPLRLKASQDPNTFDMKKSPQEEVYKQAISDFKEASDLLPLKNTPGKPTKGAAFAFLGKVYLYMKNWKEAKNVLEPLTKSPYTYELVGDFHWNFDEAHENNAESIFEILMADLGGEDIWGNGENANSTQSTSRAKEYAAPEVGGWYEATPTKQMMDIFLKEKDKDGNYDYRARTSVAWNYPSCMYYQKPFQNVFADNLNSTWILKYQNSQTRESEPSPPKSFINVRAMRYDNVILMLAEANLELGNLNKSIGYIDQIRLRANLSPYSGKMIKEAIKKDLIHQRAIEFFVEGQRFYDLRRWGLLEEYLKKESQGRFANFSKKNYYFPIPAKEMQTNDLITQLDGW